MALVTLLKQIISSDFLYLHICDSRILYKNIEESKVTTCWQFKLNKAGNVRKNSYLKSLYADLL
jgi:hypothetical protein